MMAPLASAVYEGIVRHRRHGPRPHDLRYRVTQLYLDLEELEALALSPSAWCGRPASRCQSTGPR